MDFSSGLASLWNGALIQIVPFLFILTVIVFFHEMGHFVVGRLCGIRVLAFSIGFGPELLGYTARNGTRWKICAIPLGGYVKFLGDENAASVPDQGAVAAMSEEERAEAFPAKSVGKRAATVVAGPLANFLLSIAIFAGIAYFGGRVVGDPVVSGVTAGSPAEAAGFRPGDRVISLDGEAVQYFSDVQRYVAGRAGIAITAEVEQGGQRRELTVTPQETTQTDRFGNSFKLAVVGLAASQDGAAFRLEKLSFVDSLRYGVSQTWFVVDQTVSFIGGIFAGRQDSREIGGPVRIWQVSKDVATLGFAATLNMAALLSVSIGLLNLLPIPILDGGHLMFYAYEAVRGRPLSERAQEFGFRIGLSLVFSLMVFAFWNDIGRPG